MKTKIVFSVALATLIGWHAGMAAQPLSCMALQFSGNSWTPSITVINRCNTTIDVSNALVQFKASQAISGSYWGSFGNLGYPQSTTIVSSKVSNTSYLVTLPLVFDPGNQWWKPNTLLAANSQIRLQFSATPTLNVSELAFFSASAPPPTPTGTVNFVLPAAPGNTSNPAVIQVTGSNGTSYSTTINNAAWNSTYALTAVPYGTYNISVNGVSVNQQLYNGVVTPNPLSLNSASATATIAYQAVRQTGNIQFNLNAQLPESNLAAPSIQVTNISNGQPAVSALSITWNGTALASGLNAGDAYRFSANTLVGRVNQYIPAFTPATVNVSPNATTVVNVAYNAVPIATTAITANIAGIPAGASASVQFVDHNNNVFVSPALSNGNNVIVMNLPQGRQYTVSAPSLTFNGNSYSTAITPSSFTLTQSPQSLSILISQLAPQTKKLAAYWGGWTGYQYDLHNTYGNLPLTDLYLAFANYSNGQIDTAASGYLTRVPAPLSQIWPSYQNWTTYAYRHPQTHVMLSVGGATYGAIWSNLNSMEKAQTMANTIVQILQTPFPVYAPAGNTPSVAFAINGLPGSAGPQYGNSHLLGYVTLSGVDLDVEIGDAAQYAALTPYLIAVAQAIHQAAPDKLITFATFSVAADPANACTVPGSAHCGEALPLINGIKNHSDQSLKNVVTYNVMAYDANSDFVIGTNAKYKTALQNYVNAVGDPSRVILGLDLQPQWGTPYFTLTCAQLAEQAAWAYQHPTITSGTFLWEIGDDGNLCTAFNALNAMSNAMH